MLRFVVFVVSATLVSAHGHGGNASHWSNSNHSGVAGHNHSWPGNLKRADAQRLNNSWASFTGNDTIAWHNRSWASNESWIDAPHNESHTSFLINSSWANFTANETDVGHNHSRGDGEPPFAWNGTVPLFGSKNDSWWANATFNATLNAALGRNHSWANASASGDAPRGASAAGEEALRGGGVDRETPAAFGGATHNATRAEDASRASEQRRNGATAPLTKKATEATAAVARKWGLGRKLLSERR